ncbi:MAG: leucine-rich repeat protein [Anaerolineaceae bacterium]|nr:leucine-rich repeat protein [Anaerolineaceae bacterium]
MKKSIIFIIIMLLCAVIPVSAQEAEPEILTSGDWQYQANETGWTITEYTGTAKNITIPSEFDGTPVTTLAESLFQNYMNLEKVVIPNSVTTLGKFVFQGCGNLKEATLSLNLKAVPESTFEYCAALENIAFPASVRTIGNSAFKDCTSLSDINLPGNLSTVGESAFENCSSLRTINVSRSLSTVGADAFKGTLWLERQTDEFVYIGRGILLRYNGESAHVELPYGTVAIANAFDGNTKVESVFLPDTVRRLMTYAFRDAVNLTEINFPQYLTTIAGGAFWGCRRLETVELPESLTTIGSNAFRDCERLTNLAIPSNVKRIESYVGGNCASLTDVWIPADATYFHKNAFAKSPNVNIQIAAGSEVEKILIDNKIAYSYYNQKNEDFIYNSDGENINIVKYVGNLYDVEVPAELDGMPVTAIGVAAFQNNPSVRRVKLPLTIRSIGDWAFSYMDDLQVVALQSGIESIGANAFTGDTKLAELKLPESLTSVGINIFDKDAMTKICAVEGSMSYDQLTNDGYEVQTSAQCSEDDVLLDQWAIANLTVGMTIDPDLAGSLNTPSTALTSRYGEDINIFRIPDGTTTVTAGMLTGAASNLILAVPNSVTAIDTEILNDRILTLVGNTGTFAEQFARDNNLKFIVRVNSWLGN